MLGAIFMALANAVKGILVDSVTTFTFTGCGFPKGGFVFALIIRTLLFSKAIASLPLCVVVSRLHLVGDL